MAAIMKYGSVMTSKLDVISAGVKRFGIDKMYVARTLEFIDAMQPGEIIGLENSQTRDQFIQVMKLYIYMYQGFTFKKDYTRLQKDYKPEDFIYSGIGRIKK